MPIHVDAFPGPLDATDGEWQLTDGRLTGRCGPGTDLFVDPATAKPSVNAPRLMATPPDGDFQFSARVRVGFAATFDAGVLLLWSDEQTWAKLCFEYSPQGEPMIVSVVTHGRSDDANGFTVDGDTVWLRISRNCGAYAFHASTDGEVWHFVRHFSLADATPQIGFEVQSPTGDGLTATFSEIAFRRGSLADLRDGS